MEKEVFQTSTNAEKGSAKRKICRRICPRIASTGRGRAHRLRPQFLGGGNYDLGEKDHVLVQQRGGRKPSNDTFP